MDRLFRKKSVVASDPDNKTPSTPTSPTSPSSPTSPTSSAPSTPATRTAAISLSSPTTPNNSSPTPRSATISGSNVPPMFQKRSPQGQMPSGQSAIQSVILDLTEDSLRKLLGGKEPRSVKYPLTLNISGPRCSLDSLDSLFQIIPHKALHTLDFSNNEVSSLFLDNKDSNLQLMIGSNNKIQSLKLSLPKLRELDLSRNLLPEFPILNLPDLTVLNLSKNKLTGMCVGIRDLPKLVRLDLSDNQLRWSNMEFIGFLQLVVRLKNLVELSIHGNDFFEMELNYRLILVRFCPKLKVIDGISVTSEEKKTAKEIIGHSSSNSWQELQRALMETGSIISRRPSVSESVRTGLTWFNRRPSMDRPAPSNISSAQDNVVEETIAVLNFQELFSLIQDMRKTSVLAEIMVKLCEFEGTLIQAPIDIQLQFISHEQSGVQVKFAYDSLFSIYEKYLDNMSLRCIIRLSCLLYINNQAPEEVSDWLHQKMILYDLSFSQALEEILTHALMSEEVPVGAKDRLMLFACDCWWSDNILACLRPAVSKVFSELQTEWPIYACCYFALLSGDREAMSAVGEDRVIDSLFQLYKMSPLPTDYHHPFITMAIGIGCQRSIAFYQKARNEIPLQDIIEQCKEIISGGSLDHLPDDRKLKLLSLLELTLGLLGAILQADGELVLREGVQLEKRDFLSLCTLANSGIGGSPNNILSARFARLMWALLQHSFIHFDLKEVEMGVSVSLTTITDPVGFEIQKRSASFYYSVLTSMMIWIDRNKSRQEKLSLSTIGAKMPTNTCTVLSQLLLKGDDYFQIFVLNHLHRLLNEDSQSASPQLVDNVTTFLKGDQNFMLCPMALIISAKLLSTICKSRKDCVEHRTDLVPLIFNLLEWGWNNRRIIRNSSILSSALIGLCHDLYQVSEAFTKAFMDPKIELKCDFLLMSEEAEEAPSAPSFIESTPIGLRVEFVLSLFGKVKPYGRLGWRVVRQLSRCIEDRLHPETLFGDCDSISPDLKIPSDGGIRESARLARQNELYQAGVLEKIITYISNNSETEMLCPRELVKTMNADTQKIEEIKQKEIDDRRDALGFNKGHAVMIDVLDEQQKLTIAEKTAKSKLLQQVNQEVVGEDRFEEDETILFRKTEVQIEAQAAQDGLLVPREYVLSESLSFFLRVLWYSSKEQRKDARLRFRTDIGLIQGLVSVALGCDFMTNNIGAMLFALLGELSLSTSILSWN
eukprot:TRINITY_DN1310_c0_g1_i4.p1 TRINITY_DN1310_c0_g1~~TRINITY_DN1310_c0_g1_i4.p1  ORF type:complete len:1218 (+),score=240.45 TRINITY_DN1310_c0_g1_i4:49-3702(+)